MLLLALLGCVPAPSNPYDSASPCVPADQDCDGFTPMKGDCDDDDPDVHPGGRDACGDEIDEDCSGGPQQCALVEEMPLSDADLTWGGFDERTGHTVEHGGDLTGDGIDELLATSRGGGLVEVLQIADGELVRVASLESEDGTGAHVVVPGDVTGDGIDDLVMLPEGGVSGAGQAMGWLVAGPIEDDRFVPAGDIGIFFPSAGMAGPVVTGADVDGDGLAELLVGVAGTLPQEKGRVYLLDGPIEGDVEVVVDADRMFEGGEGERLGSSVVDAGDIDGDGLSDVLLGGSGGPRGSIAYAITDVMSRQGLDGTWQWSLEESGLAPGLAGGDLDGDGYSEVVLGEPGAKDGDGRVRVVHLGTGEAIVTGWIVGPLGEGAAAGAAVQVLDDVDGDGVADLLIGGPEAQGGDGRVWLMTPEPRGAWSLGDDQIAHWNGGADYALGSVLMAPADLDGDGYGEVVVNSLEEDRLWLFFGP